MEKRLRIIGIVVVVGVIVALSALLWPRPCTPDEECVDYKKIDNTIDADVNVAL